VAQVYAERDDMAGADEMYKKALILQPNNANILVHMGCGD
jgi:Tfp pilus assembly protein PilF